MRYRNDNMLLRIAQGDAYGMGSAYGPEFLKDLGKRLMDAYA
jgi:hypothetical protein